MAPRLTALAVSAIGVTALAMLLPGREAPAQSPPRPNVVMVMTDDQTIEQMKVMDRVRARIGATGTTFQRNFASYPLCCPSRATWLSGQYSHNHGVLGNRPPTGGFYRLNSANTLPVWLGRAGYWSGHIGKYLNGYGTRDPRQVPPGWNEWYGSVDATTYNFRNYCLNENGRNVIYGAGNGTRRACPTAESRASVYQADTYTSKAVDFIRRRSPSAQPFFLSVAYLAPHSGGPNPRGPGRCRNSAKPAARHFGHFSTTPLPQRRAFNEANVRDKPQAIQALPRFTRADVIAIGRDYQCRRESLLAVDEGVGAILDQLRASGELANTLVIFTADNGFFQGEHRVKKGKIRVYEPSVRVPALMSGPGVPRGRTVKALTANVDLAATILDAANARAGRRLDGVSLLRVAHRPRRFRKRPILLENNPAESLGQPSYTAIRTTRYKYVRYRAGGVEELYDLRRDPQELRSVHNSRRYAKVKRKLRRELRKLRRCAGRSCR